MQGAGHSRILRVLELSAVVPFARPELQQLFATFSPRSNGPFKRRSAGTGCLNRPEIRGGYLV